MIIDILNKYKKEFFRNKISVGLVFIFPLFFLFIFNIAFSGEIVSEGTTYNLAIINNDEGLPVVSEGSYEDIVFSQLPIEWQEDGVGHNLSQIIFNTHYQENGTDKSPIFNQININKDEIISSIENSEVSLVLIIPKNFTLLVLNLLDNGNDQFDLSLDISQTILTYGDERSTSSQITDVIVKNIIDSFLDAIVNRDRYNSGSVTITQDTVLPDTELNLFDFIAAGIFVFSTILSASYFSAMLLADEEKGVMNRIKLSMINPWSYVGAFTLFAFIIMLIQGAFLFASAKYLFAFNPSGSYLRAYFVLILLSFGTLGLIFTAGALFKSSDAAGSGIGMSSSLIGFASGSFMPMPDVVLAKNIMSFTSGSADLLLWDILPWTHANNAIRAIFLFDQTLSDVMGDLVLLIIISFTWFILGMYLFIKKRFLREN